MESYLKEQIKKIDNLKKVLLPLDPENMGHVILTQKDFFHFYDDERSLNFSYFIDFSEKNPNDIKKFPHLINSLNDCKNSLVRVFSDAMQLDYVEFNQGRNVLNNGISIMPEKNIILALVKHQYNTHPDKDTKNPIAFIPFLLKEEETEVLNFCKDNLINLVVFDFIGLDITKTETKSFFKRSVEFELTRSNDSMQEEILFLYKNGFLWFERGPLIRDVAKFKFTHYQKDNYDFTCLKKYSLLGGTINHFSVLSVNEQEDLISTLFNRIYRNDLTTLLAHCNFPVRPSFIKTLINEVNSGVRERNVIFTTKILNQMIRHWSTAELLDVIEYQIKMGLDTSSVRDIRDLYPNAFEFAIQLIHGTKTLNEYPFIAKLVTQLSKTEHFNKVVSELCQEETVQNILDIKQLYPHIVFDTKNLVHNSDFMELVEIIKPSSFSNLELALPELSLTDLKHFLQLEENGTMLEDVVFEHIADILNKNFKLNAEHKEFLFTYVTKQTNLDKYLFYMVYSYKFDDLLAALQNEQIGFSLESAKFMYFKLWNFQKEPKVKAIIEHLKDMYEIEPMELNEHEKYIRSLVKVKEFEKLRDFLTTKQNLTVSNRFKKHLINELSMLKVKNTVIKDLVLEIA